MRGTRNNGQQAYDTLSLACLPYCVCTTYRSCSLRIARYCLLHVGRLWSSIMGITT